MATTSTALGTIGAAKSPSSKKHISLNVRKIDNGYILSVNIDRSDSYESVELAITSLPKLLKAIGTFLREEEAEDSNVASH